MGAEGSNEVDQYEAALQRKSRSTSRWRLRVVLWAGIVVAMAVASFAAAVLGS